MIFRILSICFLFTFASSYTSGQIATGLPGCLVVDNQEGMQCGPGSSHFFGVNVLGQFEVTNVDGIACCGGSPGGDTQSYFEFEEMNISCYQNVVVSIDYSASLTDYEDDSPGSPVFGCVGFGVPDNSHDQIVFTYIIDGGAEIQDLYIHGTTQADFTGNWTSPSLSGNTLRVKIYASNKASAESFYFENLVVTGDEIPLTAGPDDMICGDLTYDLQGTGCGIWTGGSGTFSDVTDPTATYTFDASEINSSITLTFTTIGVTVDCELALPSTSDDVTLMFFVVEANPLTISECTTNLETYDLTQHNTDINATETVTWYNGQPSMGGTLISPASSANISGGIDLWALVTDGSGCTEEVQITVNESPGPMGQLSGFGDLCPGDCVDVTVDAIGGTQPYNLTLSLFSVASVSIPGATVSTIITICYGTGGPLFDAGTNTFNVPEPFIPLDFSLELELDGIIDSDNCIGTVTGGPLSIQFNQGTEINSAGPLEACDMGNGMAEFDLSSLDNTINGFSGLSVVYYSDMDGNNIITSPYTSSSTTIYAQVLDNPCNSDIIPIMLSVVSNGDAGDVTFYCSNPVPSGCTICRDATSPPIDVDLFMMFASSSVDSFTVILTNPDGSTSTTTITTIAVDDLYSFNIDTTTIFEIEIVYLSGDCPDDSDLGGPVTVTLINAPRFDVPGPLDSCGQVTLPVFTNVSTGATPLYYTMPNGMGTSMPAGTVITTSVTLYAYAGVTSCDLEYPVIITIEEEPTLDPVSDTTACGSFILPMIAGTNLSSVNYYGMSGGLGDTLSAGDVLTSDATIYIFSPCGNTELSFDVDITAGPIFYNGDTIVCNFYIVTSIVGETLSGNEGYFSESMGTGLSIVAGDTIFADSTIYIYDPFPGCEQDIPIDIIVQHHKEAGNDSLITLCVGMDMDFDPRTIIGIDTDTSGFWIFFNTDDTLGKITNFNFRDSLVGTYDYMYAIEDSICGNDSALVSFVIVDNNGGGSGQQMDISICIDDQQGFDDAIGTYDSGSTWSRIISGDTIAFNPSTFIIANQMAGVDSFLNIFDSGDCGVVHSLLAVTIETPLSAGDNVPILVCGDVIINLDAELVNHDEIGTFSEEILTGGLVGNTFNTAGLFGIQEVYHIVNNGGMCPSDTALISINISSGPTAGDDEMGVTCTRDINLFDYLASNADLGGDFFLNGVIVLNGLFQIDPFPPLTFQYVVGDGIDCPIDEADITISFGTVPDVKYLIPLNFCYEECRNFRVAISDIRVDTVYLTITDGVTSFPLVVAVPPNDTAIVTLCNYDDGIFDGNNLEPNQIYNINIDSLRSLTEGCTYDGGIVTSDIMTNIYESDLIAEFCKDTTIMIGGLSFDRSKPVGDAVIVDGGQYGCDSIVHVQLTYYDINFGLQNYSACKGMPYTDPDFGQVWTEIDNQRDITIVNGSVNGCDSIVSVTVTFTDEVVTPYPEMICEGDSITILGTVFWSGNPSGMINTNIQSVAGCDSFINVMVTFEPQFIFDLTGSVCEEFFTTRGGVIFDKDNIGATAVIGTSPLGCDSIIVNMLDYSLPDESFNIDTIVCSQSFSLDIGGEIFDITRPSGMITLPTQNAGNCDTIITVNITFQELIVTSSVINADCSSNGMGSIIIESIGGSSGPFTLNNNPIDLSALPLEIPIVGGSDTTLVFADVNSLDCSYMETFSVGSIMMGSFNISEIDSQLIVTSPDSNIDSIVWSPSLGLSCTSCLDPIATPDSTTSYLATIYYESGCIEMLSITVEISGPPPRFKDYFVPNIFNPNGSIGNRVFYVTPSTFADGLVVSMRIFDRWGNLVYESRDVDYLTSGGGWDGSFDGRRIRTGVYVYAIDVVEPEGRTVQLLGDVTVLR